MSETFLNKSGMGQVLTGYLSLGHQPSGDWTNTCYSTKHFAISTINHWPKRPENQLTIPFPVQQQMQCFC